MKKILNKFSDIRPVSEGVISSCGIAAIGESEKEFRAYCISYVVARIVTFKPVPFLPERRGIMGDRGMLLSELREMYHGVYPCHLASVRHPKRIIIDIQSRLRDAMP